MFGFVRYGTVEEAKIAFVKLNGLPVQGKKLLVSMARYEKGGAPIRKLSLPGEKKKIAEIKKTWSPAFRDHRSYLDVAQGLKHKLEALESFVA